MVKKVSLKKDDLKQISGGWIEEYSLAGDVGAEVLFFNFFEVYDEKNGNLVGIFLNKEDAANCDKNHTPGTAPDIDEESARRKFFVKNGLPLNAHSPFDKNSTFF